MVSMLGRAPLRQMRSLFPPLDSRLTSPLLSSSAGQRALVVEYLFLYLEI
jgi:hypothetical protein